MKWLSRLVKLWRRDEYRARDGRRAPRLKASYLINYIRIDGGIESDVRTANTKDLSAIGVRFYAPEKLSIGDSLRIQVLVPALDRKISAFARVTRVEESPASGLYYISSSFVEIGQEDQEALDASIRRCLNSREADMLFDNQDIVSRKTGAGEKVS